jgi:Tfp pilus assembly protein PilF
MTEWEIVETVRAQFAGEEPPGPEALRMVEEGLESFPKSVRLWILRGDLIQLSSDEASYCLEDAMTSYQKASECDPENGEPYESIGYFLDAVMDEPAKAEPYFRKAIALGRTESAADGLARVLAQIHRVR